MITTQGPLLVLAGAGTGKTRVITSRIAYLLAEGVSPMEVLAVTFTNKAALEMRQRIARVVDGTAEGLTVGTFHAFCVRVLRAHGDQLGLPPSFSICDSSDQLAAVKSVMRELRVHESAMHPSALLARISLAKNRLSEDETDDNELVATVKERYQEYLLRTRSVDFDDLLLLTRRLLRSSSELRERFRKRFRYVLVDEFQDTNLPQYEIVREIADGHRNICVVGDDDQSIYGWRGADVQKILGFDRDFPGAKVVRLQTNYRSTQPILDAANKVIRNNPSRHEKSLHSANGDGEPVRLTRLSDETMEAQFVAEEVLRLVQLGKAKLSDFAVLFRTGTQPRPFEAEFRRAGIPYVLVGGMSFFDRKEVRDVMAYLKVVANPEDETSFLRIVNTPPRGIGKTTIDRALEVATDRGVPLRDVFERGDDLPDAALAGYRGLRDALTRSELSEPGTDLVSGVKKLIDAVDYRVEVRRAYPDPMTREARWAAVEEVVNFASNYMHKSKEPTLVGFLEELSLVGRDDLEDRQQEPGNVVTLSTLHAAKGLEFPRVFLVGIEEGLLPHARSVEEGGIEEERRLAYVGITRAMWSLTVSFVETRAKYGRRAATMPSRFLFEMRDKAPPEDWVPVEDAMSKTASAKPSASDRRSRKK